MFLLTLNKVIDKEILTKVYSTIANYNLQKIAYVCYKPDFEKKSYKINNLIADFMLIELKSLEPLGVEKVEDIIYDLTEKEANYIIDKTGASKEFVEMFDELCDEIGLEFRDMSKLIDPNKVDIKNLSFNDKCIALEMFGVKNPSYKYTDREFKVRLVVEENGDVFCGEKIVGNVLEVDFITLMFKVDVKEDTEERKSSFGFHLYEPWFFLNENIDHDQIIEYKVAVFEAIKNINPKDYCCLPSDLLEVMNSNNYIQFKDLINIIKGEDKTLINYY